MEIRTPHACLFPFQEGDKVFVDGYRVLNPQNPVRVWRWSDRRSPTSSKVPVVGHWAWDINEAVHLLHGMHAIELFFDHVPGIFFSTAPCCPVFVNLRDGKKSWARHCSFPERRFEPGTSFSEDAWLGYAIRDGAKFTSSTDLNPQQERFIVIKDRWLPEMVRMLNAYHSKGYLVPRDRPAAPIAQRKSRGL